MKVLIIDNCTNHLDNIITILAKAYPNLDLLTTNYYNLNNNYDSHKFDLVVLSGGKPNRHSKLSEDERQVYINYEKELILHSQVPIIGICYGFKLICETYNSNIEYQPSIIKGEIAITLQDQFAAQMEIKNAKVHVQHHFITTQVGQSLQVLANSKYGIEVVKHTTKPIYGFQFHPEINPELQDGDEIMLKVLKLLAFDINSNN
jgi:anthranilate/para-aminobenzoate synthase component II